MARKTCCLLGVLLDSNIQSHWQRGHRCAVCRNRKAAQKFAQSSPSNPTPIVSYYVLAVFGLGLSVSSADPLLALPTSKGPVRNYPGGFVIMAERAGIPVLPDLINVVMIIAAFSMATAGLFVAV
jgi:amino acid permease